MNASVPAKIRINGEEFVTSPQRRPDDRDEVDGELVAMPRDTFGHNRTNGDAVDAAALPCQVFTDRAAVKISEKTLRIPDVGAHCAAELGPQALPGRRAIVQRQRNATGKIESRIGRDGETALDPPGISVSVVALPS